MMSTVFPERVAGVKMKWRAPASTNATSFSVTSAAVPAAAGDARVETSAHVDRKRYRNLFVREGKRARIANNPAC